MVYFVTHFIDSRTSVLSVLLFLTFVLDLAEIEMTGSKRLFSVFWLLLALMFVFIH